MTDVKSRIDLDSLMYGHKPFQTPLQWGIENQGFEQIEKKLWQITPQISEKKVLVLGALYLKSTVIFHWSSRLF